MSSKTRKSKPDSGPYPVIHELECKACGRCISACPVSALALGTAFNERGYRYVVYAGAACTGCGNCYYTCPEPGAIEVHIPLRSDPGTEQQKGS